MYLLLYLLFLLVLLILYRLSEKKLSYYKKTVYTNFENYFTDLYLYLEKYSQDFYHKDKARDVFYTHVTSFFSLSSYPISIFREYQKKFSEDALFIDSLLPDTIEFQLKKEKGLFFSSASNREFTYNVSDFLLTVFTLGVRKLLTS